MTKVEIYNALESGHRAIAEYVLGLPEANFFDSSPQQWGPAHHLGHLSLVHEAVTRGFVAKQRLQEYTEPSKSYESFRDSYLEKLKTAPANFFANNPFTATVEGLSQESLINTFRQKAQTLCHGLQDYSEDELDHKAMKHPLVGLISAREMAMFTVFHDQHHLNGMKRLLSREV
jgi:hypothetical protein